MTGVARARVHTTDLLFETKHLPGGQVTVCHADCEACEWTASGDEKDVRGAAWMHEVQHSPEQAEDLLRAIVDDPAYQDGFCGEMPEALRDRLDAWSNGQPRPAASSGGEPRG